MSRPEFFVRMLLECGEEFELITNDYEGLWELDRELKGWIQWLTWGSQDMENRRCAFKLVVESEAFKKYGIRARWQGWLKGDAYVIEEYTAPERTKEDG